MTKVFAYLKALTELSKEHGIWIDASKEEDDLNLVDSILSEVALEFKYDPEKQAYSVKSDFEAMDKLN